MAQGRQRHQQRALIQADSELVWHFYWKFRLVSRLNPWAVNVSSPAVACDKLLHRGEGTLRGRENDQQKRDSRVFGCGKFILSRPRRGFNAVFLCLNRRRVEKKKGADKASAPAKSDQLWCVT